VQVEERATRSSPILTNGAATPRNADVLTMPFAAAAPWTVFQDCKPQVLVDTDHAIFGYASVSDVLRIARATTSYAGEIADGLANPAANVADEASGYTTGARLKAALVSEDGSEVVLAINGVLDESAAGGSAVDTSGFATLGVGQVQTGGPDIPITVRHVQRYTVAKTAAQLEPLTII
jgi:hypothetical protein